MSSEPPSQPMPQSPLASSLSDDISAHVSDPIQLPGYFEDVQLDDLAVLIGALCLLPSPLSMLTTTPFIGTFIRCTFLLNSGPPPTHGRPQ